MADTLTTSISVDAGPGAAGGSWSEDGIVESIQIPNGKLPGSIFNLPTNAPTVLPFGPLAAASALMIKATRPIKITLTVNNVAIVMASDLLVMLNIDPTQSLTAVSIQGITAGAQVDWLIGG